jgi:phenylpropionate dioxygenase-like ring-hydroxylating dioxygenase large terminal subunit
MIHNQWYAILESSEIKRGRPVGVTRMGEKLVAWRDSQGQATVMQDLCPHRGVALSIGALRGDCVECPFHGFQYDTSGRCQLIPANGKSALVPKAFQVQTYPTREAHGFIFIWWGEPQETYPPLPFPEDIDESFTYSTFRDHWTVHYSRAIENQLDVVHLPFVHANTIGRGGRTLVNGPLARWERDRNGLEILNLWVYNAVDEGQQPLKPGEIPEPDRPPFLQFYFPNVWQLRISEEVRNLLAFAPIDAENTLLYLRFYQKFVTLPILRKLITVLAVPTNVRILRQDKRVVLTQRPNVSSLHMGEKLIQGDGPIIAYRRRRHELSKILFRGQENSGIT